MDLSYVIPMGIFGMIGAYFSMKLLLIKKEKLIKAVANPRAFLTDLKLLVLASVLGVVYFIFTLSEDTLHGKLIGIFSGLIYVIVSARMVRRYGRW